MSCCSNPRPASITAKCSDRCSVRSDDYNDDGCYVPSGMGIGGGDYVEFTWCRNCGRIEGEWPADAPRDLVMPGSQG